MEGAEKIMILDVGCGHNPRGDVNCDLMLPDSDLRWDLNPSWIPNFVRADVRFLPFRSRSFDHVHCSHLIEHLEDPWAGINELKRVSRKTVAVIVPFALFRILDVLDQRSNFSEWIRWQRQNHKHHFLMDPFKTGSFKMRFLSLRGAIRGEKSFSGLLRIPIPKETLTVFEVDQNE